MPTFIEIADGIRNLDFEKAIFQTLSSTRANDIVLSILKKRLETQGIDNDGKKLKTDNSSIGQYYSYYTQIKKKKKSQVTDRVTLKDTGDFYSSLYTKVNGTDFYIGGSFEKEDGNMYENFKKMYPSESDFENAISALSEDEFSEILRLWLSDIIVENLKKQNI